MLLPYIIIKCKNVKSNLIYELLYNIVLDIEKKKKTKT